MGFTKEVLPDSVLTIPLEEITRIRFPLYSLTYTLPLSSAFHTPKGRYKDALVAGYVSPADTAEPVPINSVTIPLLRLTMRILMCT